MTHDLEYFRELIDFQFEKANTQHKGYLEKYYPNLEHTPYTFGDLVNPDTSIENLVNVSLAQRRWYNRHGHNEDGSFRSYDKYQNLYYTLLKWYIDHGMLEHLMLGVDNIGHCDRDLGYPPFLVEHCFKVPQYRRIIHYGLYVLYFTFGINYENTTIKLKWPEGFDEEMKFIKRYALVSQEDDCILLVHDQLIINESLVVRDSDDDDDEYQWRVFDASQSRFENDFILQFGLKSLIDQNNTVMKVRSI